MKTKLLLFCLLLGMIYIGCDDNISNVGISIQPDSDKISVFDTTVVVGAKTIKVDSIYAKTTNGFLGEFYDPSYGTVKSSYACQFYPSIGFGNTDSILNGKIDSVKLAILYDYYKGDSLAPMELAVYPIRKNLDKNYYTNVDPATFCDLNNPMVRYGYTARNMHVSDFDLYLNYYHHGLGIPLPTQLGQDYFDKVKKNEIKNANDFLNFFPGIYLSTTFGSGSMLYVDQTEIYVYFTRYTALRPTSTTLAIDSFTVDEQLYYTYPDAAGLMVTKEVIQLNSFKNTNDVFLLEDNPDKIYLKSPSGVFAELTVPIRDIMKGIGKKKFSSVKLSLNAYPKDDWEYTLGLPGTGQIGDATASKLLLIEPDSVKNFFEQQMVADYQTSYTASFNSSTYSYDFNNIANVVQNAINNAPDQDLKLWLIPVQTTFSQTSSGLIDYATAHYLYPSGVTLKKGGDNLKVRVIATDLKIND